MSPQSLKKLFVLSLAAGLTAPAIHAAKNKKLTGDDLSNMIIEGENRLNVHPPIPEVEWTPALYRDVNSTLDDNGVIADLQPPTIIHGPTQFLPTKSLSSKTASPWLTGIHDSPVLTLRLKLKRKLDKIRWSFFVKDSQGKTFYELKKKGAIPPSLSWDGMGNNGQPLKTGYDYSYSFSLVDEAGNPQRYSGQSFRLNAFQYKKGGRSYMTFAPESLFTERNSSKLSQQGVNYLTEVKDILRTSFGGKVAVMSYEDDASFAESRGRVVRDFLKKVLDIPEDKITVESPPLRQGGDYRHVDIVAY